MIPPFPFPARDIGAPQLLDERSRMYTSASRARMPLRRRDHAEE